VTVRYSARALRHLEQIHEYVARDKQAAADETIEGILSAARRLLVHPKLGREGIVKGTRELVHPPFVLVYRIKRDAISLEAVFHDNQRYHF